MTPTLGPAPSSPPPPAAAATASAPQPAAAPQPSDNRQEFSRALDGARSQGKPPRAPASAPDERAESPPGGKALPGVAASGSAERGPAADGGGGKPDGAPTDGGDSLQALMDMLAPGAAPIVVPPAVSPAPVAGAGSALSPETGDGDAGATPGLSSAVAMPGFSAPVGAAVSPAAGDAGFAAPVDAGLSSALAAQDDSTRSPTVAANELLPDLNPKGGDGRESLPLAAASPPAIGLHGGDVAGTPPPQARAADAAASAKSVEQPVELPVGQAGWGRELGSRVLWLARDNQQYAELHLNPPNLGPLEVRIALQSDQGATISFLSNHAAVRDAVTDALPQLRDLFAEGGFTALDVSVSHQSAGGAHSRGPQGGNFPANAQESVAVVDNESDGQRRLHHPPGAGLVDYFA